VNGLRRFGLLRSIGITMVVASAGAIGVIATQAMITHLFRGTIEIRGFARVVDGDSLVVDGTPVRLKGIDAPELRQTCRRGAEDWRCGESAKSYLRELLAGQQIACSRSGSDRNGRILAYCRAGGARDVGAQLVREGWAVAYDATYAAEESEAKRARRGLWASTFERPRIWRDAHRGDVTE
jgi:endonuclease YncB( thermonuclease family)